MAFNIEHRYSEQSKIDFYMEKNCIKGMIHFKFFYKAVPFKNFIVNSDMFMKMSLEKYGQRALKNLPYPRSEV